MARLLRDPLATFLALGALLFAGYWLVNRQGEAIEVSAAVQQGLAADYRLMRGHAPDAAERRRLIDDYVADEVLFREAVARGMHLTDRATKARLVDRLRFLIAGAPRSPGEAELIDFYSTHGEMYRAEPQISLEQVYFQKSPADPAAVLAKLRAGQRVAGDDFWMGRRFPDYGESMLRGMFGQDLLAVARSAEPGVWTGPLGSPRGVHFIRVDGRAAPGLMRYTDVRDQVRQDMLSAQSARAVAAEVARMEAKYAVDIEG